MVCAGGRGEVVRGAGDRDSPADRHGGRLKVAKERALVAEVRIGTARVVLAFPQTFYNESSNAARLLLERHGIDDLHHLVVVHDEMDLPPAS